MVISSTPLWEQYERIIKPNGAILLFGQDKFTATMMLSNLVLDNCCGIGATLIAAKLKGRQYIGINNSVCDKKKSRFYGLPWAEVARQRLEAINVPQYEPA